MSNQDAKGRFVPGNKAGQGGYLSPKVKPFLDALHRAIAQDNGERIRKAAEKLLDAAAEGEPWALDMLANRTDGKPKQQLEHTGMEDGPVEIVARWISEGRQSDS